MRPGRDHGPRPDPRAGHARRAGARASTRPIRITVAPRPAAARGGRAGSPASTTVEDDDAGARADHPRSPSAVLTRLAERDALDGLQVQAATLEDVFLDLTGREYRA